MNIERINELMRQAIIWCDENFPELEGYYGEELEYKFAELIIRECAKSADDWYINNTKLHVCASDHIKEHFGVEE